MELRAIGYIGQGSGKTTLYDCAGQGWKFAGRGIKQLTEAMRSAKNNGLDDVVVMTNKGVYVASSPHIEAQYPKDVWQDSRNTINLSLPNGETVMGTVQSLDFEATNARKNQY